MSNRRIVLIVVGSVIGGMVLVVGCLALFLATYGDPAGKPLPHPVVVGGRIDDGQLTIALGCEPPVEASVSVRFRPIDPPLNAVPFPKLEFRVTSPLSVFDPMMLPVGAELDSALPADFQLSEEESLSVTLIMPQASSSYTPSLSLGNLAADSIGRPQGVFWFGSAGWLTPQEVVARDGVNLLTVCSTLPK